MSDTTVPQFEVMPPRQRVVRVVCRYPLASCSIKNFNNMAGLKYDEVRTEDSHVIQIGAMEGTEYKTPDYLFGLMYNVCNMCQKAAKEAAEKAK